MKNEEPLIIPIATPAHEALKEAMKVAHFNSQVVFWHADGKPYTPIQVQRAFKEELKMAEIEDFGSMTFSIASRRGTGRYDLDTLADLIVHNNTRMTWRYAHIGPAYLASASSKLDKSYGGFSTNLEQSKERSYRKPVTPEYDWRPQGDSNPCYRRERAVSWAGLDDGDG